jgi:hypothetical protein
MPLFGGCDTIRFAPRRPHIQVEAVFGSSQPIGIIRGYAAQPRTELDAGRADGQCIERIGPGIGWLWRSPTQISDGGTSKRNPEPGVGFVWSGETDDTSETEQTLGGNIGDLNGLFDCGVQDAPKRKCRDREQQEYQDDCDREPSPSIRLSILYVRFAHLPPGGQARGLRSHSTRTSLSLSNTHHQYSGKFKQQLVLSPKIESPAFGQHSFRAEIE